MKKSTVAVYKSNESAINAVKHLVKSGIPENELSVIGEGQLVEDHIHFVPVKKYKMAPIIIGVIGGGLIGVLAGAGIIDLPVLGHIEDSGGFVGLLAGLTIGAAIGAAITVLVSILVKKDELVVLQKHIDNGRYAVVVKGSDGDILRAKELLHKDAKHENLMHLKGK